MKDVEAQFISARVNVHAVVIHLGMYLACLLHLFRLRSCSFSARGSSSNCLGSCKSCPGFFQDARFQDASRPEQPASYEPFKLACLGQSAEHVDATHTSWSWQQVVLLMTVLIRFALQFASCDALRDVIYPFQQDCAKQLFPHVTKVCLPVIFCKPTLH